MAAQALRCGCHGTNDLCPCQNAPDAKTVADHNGTQRHLTARVALLVALLLGAPAEAQTTWGTTSSSTTLSNGNLTVTGDPVTGGDSLTISTTTKTTGKWFFELQPAATPGTDTGGGISNAGASRSTYGPSADGVIYYKGTGNIWINGAMAGCSLAIVHSARVAVAVDFDADLIWLGVCPAPTWNGSGCQPADPATGVGGLSISALTGPFPAAVAITNGTTGSYTLVPEPPFLCSALTGFTAWGERPGGMLIYSPLTHW